MPVHVLRPRRQLGPRRSPACSPAPPGSHLPRRQPRLPGPWGEYRRRPTRRGDRRPAAMAPTGAPTAAPSQPVLTDEERDTVELPMWSIALGLVLGLLGSIAINTGNNLQSMGLKELQKKEELDELDNGGSDEAEKPAREPSESRTWVVGTTIFVTGALLNFASAFARRHARR